MDETGKLVKNAAVETGPFLGLTLFLSIAAASFGITKFLKAGPASIVRNDKWMDGFGTWTFILLFLNVACTLIAKGGVVGVCIGALFSAQSSSVNYLLIFIFFLPQCLHVSSIVLYLVKH